MERTKSDTAEITPSIRLLDPGNKHKHPAPEHSGYRLPPKQTGAARGGGDIRRILYYAQRAYEKSAMSKVLCWALGEIVMNVDTFP